MFNESNGFSFFLCIDARLMSIIDAFFFYCSDAQTCRLAFHGKIIRPISSTDTAQLKVYTKKEKEGKIERV
jgi:hypothetical protein